MSRRLKTFFWLAGVIVLVCMVSYPIQEVKDAWTVWSSPLSGKVIVLDPGHGGPDGGAIGGDGTEEKVITLKMAEYLQDYLQQAGALVYMTRYEDADLASEGTSGLSRRKSEDISNRVKFIEEKEADLYLSLHLNAIPSGKWSGHRPFTIRRVRRVNTSPSLSRLRYKPIWAIRSARLWGSAISIS